MVIFPDYVMVGEKRISHYEALKILAEAMNVMENALNVEDGYTHYDLAMSLKYNVVSVSIGEENNVKLMDLQGIVDEIESIG